MDQNSPSLPASTFDGSRVEGVNDDIGLLHLELEVLKDITTFLTIHFDKFHIPVTRRDRVLQKYWQRMRQLNHQLKHQQFCNSHPLSE